MTKNERQISEELMTAVRAERGLIASRRRFLTGAAKIAGGSAFALAAVGAGPAGRLFAQDATPDTTLPTASDFANDLEVLNYALTLEHLEYAFYRDGLTAFASDDFMDGVYGDLLLVRDHEAAHVALLTNAITQLGGTPVTEGEYDFGYGNDPDAFLETAMALENTGVSAYDGAGAAIQSKDLLAVAGQIVAVEARHASYLNDINGDDPFPMSFETPMTRAEVLEIAEPFIVAG